MNDLNLDEARELSLDEARSLLSKRFSQTSIDKIIDIRNAHQALTEFFKKHDSSVPNNFEIDLLNHFRDFFESEHVYSKFLLSHESFDKTRISDMHYVIIRMDEKRKYSGVGFSPDDLELYGLLYDAIFEHLRYLVYQDKIEINTHIETCFFTMKPFVWFQFVLTQY